MVRLRIAPSPTGYPHIGTIYQALFNWAFAKKQGGQFIVRIEDTDRERFVADAEEKLYQALTWFGLEEAESPRKGGPYGPYKQSERIQLYQKYAQELLDKGHAYFAYLPKLQAGKKKDYTHKEESLNDGFNAAGGSQDAGSIPPKSIQEMLTRTDWVLRMKVPKDTKIIIKDELRGEITFESNQVSEQVLLKSDGFPTYHLAAVVDDHLMGITHVVRAEEWLSSTPKHWLLYEYFDWEKPLFFHTAILRNPDKSKLSKRQGHTNVAWYHSEGYLPHAILNFLALMGWSHPEEKEMFAIGEFIQIFDLKDLKAVGPIFDVAKLTWMNGMYIREMPTDKLTQAVKNYEEVFGQNGHVLRYIDIEKLQKIVALAQTRMNTLKEFYPLTKHLLEKTSFFVQNEKDKQIAKALKSKFEVLSDWNKDTILEVFRSVMSEQAIRMPALYTIATGKPQGIPLPESFELMGKEDALRRLDEVVR